MRVSLLTASMCIIAHMLTASCSDSSNTNHEIQTIVRDLNHHIQFFSGLIDGDQEKVSDWFSRASYDVSKQLHSHMQILINNKPADLLHDKKLGQLYDLGIWLMQKAEEILGLNDEIRVGLGEQFATFPFKEVSDKLCSLDVKNALKSFQDTGSFAALAHCWNTKIIDASTEPILKDFANLIYILYHHIDSVLMVNGKLSDRDFSHNYIFNLVTIYDKVNALRIEDTLDAISKFIKRLKKTMIQLQSESALSFEGWLKS